MKLCQIPIDVEFLWKRCKRACGQIVRILMMEFIFLCFIWSYLKLWTHLSVSAYK